MKRLEKKLNVNDFDPENILSSKEMRGVIGGWAPTRRVTSTTHMCQILCDIGSGHRKACNEGVCHDYATSTSCITGDNVVLFTIGC